MELMILHEGWQRSELLPQNWLFKVRCEGFTKEVNLCQVCDTFLVFTLSHCREGLGKQLAELYKRVSRNIGSPSS